MRSLGDCFEIIRSLRVHALPGSTQRRFCTISANGVENFRQRTPGNAIDIATALLDAGADVDAEANVYDGRSTTMELVATSIHPERAEVQNELMLLLLDRGADIEHGTDAKNRNAILMSALANGRGSAAEFIARSVELDAVSAAASRATRCAYGATSMYRPRGVARPGMPTSRQAFCMRACTDTWTW